MQARAQEGGIRAQGELGERRTETSRHSGSETNPSWSCARTRLNPSRD
jgi:hypothetical protein